MLLLMKEQNQRPKNNIEVYQLLTMILDSTVLLMLLSMKEQNQKQKNILSKSLPTLDDDIELNSFTDVAINETTESKATKSKIRTEVEHSRILPALDDNIELVSFTDAAINETTESKSTKSKIKTEVENS